MEDLNAATLDDVKDWFETYYGPTNAVIAIAGDIDVETAKVKVEEYFGDIPGGPPLSKPKNGSQNVMNKLEKSFRTMFRKQEYIKFGMFQKMELLKLRL